MHVYDCIRPFQRSVLEFQSHPKAYAYISLAIFAAKDAEKYSFIKRLITISNKVEVSYEEKEKG